MSAHAQFYADLDTKRYVAGMFQMEQVTQASTRRMKREFQGMEKSFNAMKVGGVSMQVADVAVQLQGGARAATVLAQQGSQIAQYFGPKGQILAAVIAIGTGIYSWASGAKAANEELKRTMGILGDVQKRQSGSLAGATSDSRAAEVARMGGPRAEVGLLKMAFDDDIKKMKEDFRKTPMHLRDFRQEEIAIGARTDRFDAERGKLYEGYEETAEGKRSAEEKKRADEETSELRGMERDQLQNFVDYRKKQDEDEKEARETLLDSIKEADKVEKENNARNERIGELREQLARETAKQNIQSRAESGQSILDGAAEFLKPQSQRIAEREAEQAGARATSREISRRLDRADQHRRSIGGSGMTPEERKELRKSAQEDVKAAQNKEKLLASLDEDSVKRIADAIDKLIAI